MRNPYAIAVLVLCVSLLSPTMGYAQSDPDSVSVIAKLKYDSLASYKGGESEAPDACSIAVTGGSRLDLTTPACVAYRDFLETKVDELEAALTRDIPEARLVHRLLVVFGGVSIFLKKDRVEDLLDLPYVEAIFEDGEAKLETVRTPQFIGADRLWRELGGPDRAGEGIIVAALDSGVWPELASFSDPDPSDNPYPSPPARWRGTACDFGSDRPSDDPFECNNKLIGAQRIMDSYDAENPDAPDEFLTARDSEGHGTHVLSIAAGNGGVEASVVFGLDERDEPLAVISGVAPRAHVVAYKIFNADLVAKFSDAAAAVQQAVEDGVDVINYSGSSAGSGDDPYDDNPYRNTLSRAFLDAYGAGLVVAASAGNSGPEAESITSVEPWAITVGNSVADNLFAGTLEVTAKNGDTLSVPGVSITGSVMEPRPIVVAEDLGFDVNCNEPNVSGEPVFPPDTFQENEIVVCSRGGDQFAKGENVLEGGGSALVMYNDNSDGTQSNLNHDEHFLPAIHIELSKKMALFEFLATHEEVVAVLTQGAATSVFDFPGGVPGLKNGTAPGVDVVADSSSRGGPGQRLGISKPDLTAPGVAILAGASPLSPENAPGLYQFRNGTSMASPHAAGAAALLLDLYPDWTPGQIKSALMTTAVQDLVKEDGITPADPFDRGSGRVDLLRAFEPGLTFVGPSAEDFLDHKDDLWNVNYPSLYHPLNPGRITVERTVAGEPGGRKNWRTQVSAPPDVEIDVPKHVRIKRDGTTTFDITVDARAVPTGEVRHANLRLKSGDHEANFPITIVKSETALPLATSCEPTVFRRGETTECTITVTNTTFDATAVSVRDELPRELKLEGDVEGGERRGKRELAFEGILDGVEPPDVTVVEAESPFGYLPMASLGFEPLPDDTLGDDDIDDFGVPPYMYGGEIHTSIGFASNGYAVAGGNTDEEEDNAFLRQIMPDPERPNNVIAPFWTDLAAGGKKYIEIVDPDGSGIEWIVLEWEDVFLTGTEEEGNTFSFQIWIQVSSDQEAIFMVYGRVDDVAEGKRFSVGAENEFGNRGQTVNDEQGVPPEVGRDLAVMTTPGAPGETHTITFTAKGARTGNWENCAEMDSDAFPGTALACTEGEVRPRR
jgi:subtilisin family serine protease